MDVDDENDPVLVNERKRIFDEVNSKRAKLRLREITDPNGADYIEVFNDLYRPKLSTGSASVPESRGSTLAKGIAADAAAALAALGSVAGVNEGSGSAVLTRASALTRGASGFATKDLYVHLTLDSSTMGRITLNGPVFDTDRTQLNVGLCQRLKQSSLEVLMVSKAVKVTAGEMAAAEAKAKEVRVPFGRESCRHISHTTPNRLSVPR